MKIVDAIKDVGRPVAYYPKIARVFGIEAAIFICQLLYWDGKGDRDDGYIYKTAIQIEEETGILERTQRRLKAKLEVDEILESFYDRNKHRKYYRINKDNLNNAYENFFLGIKAPDKKVGSTGQNDRSSTGQNDRSSIHRVHIENTDTSKPATPVAKPKHVYTTPGAVLNILIEKFSPVNPEYQDIFRNTTERKALDHLVVKHGAEKTGRMIESLETSNGMTFFPTITKPTQLKNKLGELIAAYRKAGNKKMATMASKGKEISY